MTFSLKGRTAIVTGNSAGLGKEIGLILGKAGARVPINFFNDQDRAEQTLSDYQAVGIGTCLVKADVTSQADVDHLYDITEQKLGHPDILVFNATKPQHEATIENYTWEDYQNMVDCFIKSPFLMTQRGLAHMKQQKWGRIVNITSEVFHQSTAKFSAYVSAKGGQIGLTRSMSRELAPFGITVNSVAPGWIPVERHQDVPKDVKESYLATIPIERWGEAEDIANSILYFVSDEAGFVTGQTLCVNGGRTL